MGATRNVAQALAGVALVMACACGGGKDPGSEECALGIGLGSPPCTCTSWTTYVAPSGSLVTDLSTFPARATIHVGEKLTVGSSVENEQPENCNEGGWNSRPTRTASDPAVLRLESTHPAGFSVAVFVATGPGVSTVFAEDLVAPGGVVQRVGLSACTQTRTTSFITRCIGRVPLDIRVLP